jgi:hypothetical protein
MLIRETRHLILALLCSTSVLLLSAACGTPAQANQPSSTPTVNQQSTSPAGQSTPGSTSSSLTVSTSCPAAGSGRAAVMPALRLGNHNTIVFFDNNPAGNPSMALKRYDAETGKTTTILSENRENIQTAQLSGDGQWVLFIAQSANNTSEIQLVRIDGQYLQTLYCAPSGQQVDPTNSTGMQWSPDQKEIIFTQGANDNSPLPLYLLTVATGKVQLELAADPNFYIQPRTWVDDTRVDVTTSSPGNLDIPATMDILDISKGPNQQASNLQVVLGVSDTPWDFDSTYDASKLFVVRYDPTVGRAGPGTFCQISSESIEGTNGSLIFNSSTLVVSSLRVAGYGSSSLLLDVNARGAPSDQYNGIWRLNANGTGLKRLTNLPGPFNQFTQYPWSNVSRDGSLYLDDNVFGSLNGGSTTQYTNEGSFTIGWTTM